MKKTTEFIPGMGIALILVTGIIHLLDAPDSFEEMFYKGALFALSGGAAVFAAIGIYRGSRGWGWNLGAMVAGGAFVGYILSRTIGLPGIPPDEWLEPMGLLSLFAEAGFMLLYGWMLWKERTPTLQVNRV